MIPWPSSLPQEVDLNGFRVEKQSAYISSQMEFGPDKRRKRVSKVQDKYDVVMTMTVSQLSTFMTFYETTTNFGTLAFTFTDPLLNTSKEFFFDGGYTITPFGFGHYSISMKWLTKI